MQSDTKLGIFIAPVLDFLRTIPRGKVVTYGMVADHCGILNARNVSWILRKNTDSEGTPCYKVVRADGSLAAGYKFGGTPEQKKRLIAEGIEFDSNGKISNFASGAFLWEVC